MTNTPVLTCTKKTIYSVDYGDLSDFINKVYGTSKYDFVASEQSGNDSSHSFAAKKTVGENTMKKWQDEDIAQLKAKDGNTEFVTSSLFQDMVDRDLIPEGDYVVDVCW